MRKAIVRQKSFSNITLITYPKPNGFKHGMHQDFKLLITLG